MSFGDWLTQSLFPFLLAILPIVLWMAFWLFAVNWKKLWPELRAGAWAPVVLLGLVAAFVWSQLSPGPLNVLGVRLPTFGWHLLGVAVLIGSALFSGWLQGLIHYTPLEVAVEPPAHHDHDHGHGHGHDHGHEHAPADHGHGHH